MADIVGGVRWCVPEKCGAVGPVPAGLGIVVGDHEMERYANRAVVEQVLASREIDVVAVRDLVDVR